MRICSYICIWTSGPTHVNSHSLLTRCGPTDLLYFIGIIYTLKNLAIVPDLDVSIDLDDYFVNFGGYTLLTLCLACVANVVFSVMSLPYINNS